MTRLFPRSSHSNLRVFLACLLSFMTLIAPIASVAAATRNDSRAASSSSTDAGDKTELSSEQKLESFLFSNRLAAPVPTPDITATKSAAITDSDGDNKAEFGETITYNVNVANAGPGDATNVTFTDTVDPNTTFLLGSLKVSPLAFADNYTANGTGTLTVPAASGVLVNDTGFPAPSAVAIAGGATTQGGTVNLAVDGSFTYTPPAGPFVGPDTFTYTATNGQLPNDTATVTISFNATAVADSATVNEDAAATPINVLANDTDPDGGTNTIASTTQPANGTVVITGGGTGLTYQPNANYCNNPPGTTLDTFTYTLSPGGSTATVTVTVTCIDDAPVAVADSATVNEDAPATAIDVLANDTDVDGGPKSVGSVTQPANGTVVITGGGTGLTYQPNANYCNVPPGTTPDTFTYTLTPGGSTISVSVSVTCIDDSPTAVNDSTTVVEDAAATPIPVLTNDTDIDGGPKSVTSVTQPANGTVVITGGGTGLTYQPNANYCNNPPGSTLDTFTYTLTPGGSTATVTVTVTCQDDAPVAVADTATVAEDSSATAINVLANDTDVDGGPKSITSVTQPTNGTVIITGGGTGLTYQPNANYNGPDVFTYTLTPGGSSTTVTVTVTEINDTPTAGADALSDILEDSGPRTIPFSTLLANDTAGPANENAQMLNITAVSSPVGGTVQIVGTDVIFTPTANFFGAASFTYTVTDNGTTNGAADPKSTTGSVTFTITGVNDAPSFTKGADQLDTEDDGAQTVNGWATAISPGPGEGTQTVSFEITGNTNPALFSVAPAVSPTGTLTYTLAANQNGATTITLKIKDNGGIANGGVDESATQSFTITVTAVNDKPVAQPKAFTVQANMKIIGVGGFLTGVTDVDNGINGCVSNTFTLNSVSATTPAGGNVTITNASTGTIDFDPPPGASGTVTFTYTVIDTGCPGPGQVSDPATVTVTVNGPVIWFVNPAVAGPGDGRLSNPFKVLANNAGANNDADDVDAANHRIYVYAGTTTGGFTLNANEWLVGEGLPNGTSFDTFMLGGSPPAGTIARPTITGTKPTITSTANGVNLGSGNQVHGLNFSNTAGTAISSGAPAVNIGTFLMSEISINNTTSTSGSGIVLTGGGTVTATGTNTIFTDSATALLILNTNIGSGNLTFRSISSGNNSANPDPTNGIQLLSTGTTVGTHGGLIVTGDGGGSNNGSGGTIQRTTDVGISLTGTLNTSLNYMNVTNSGNDGLRGSNVTNFTLTRSNLTNNGNATAENGLQFGEATGTTPGVFGTVAITNTVINSSAGNNVHIRNVAGTLASFTVTNSSFNDLIDATGANSFLFEITDTAVLTTGLITGSTFQNNTPQRALEVQTHNTGTITKFTVQNSTFIDNGIHASFTQDTASNLTFNFINNGTLAVPITGTVIQPINVFSSAVSTGGTIRGRIEGNFIGNSAVAGSGSSGGPGIVVNIQGRTQGTLLINNNRIRQVGFTTGSPGMLLDFRGTTAGSQPITQSDLTLTNNDVQTNAPAATSPLEAILIRADNQGSPARLRADIRGNIVPSTGTFGYPTFSGNDAQLSYIEAAPGAEGQLVDNGAASANADAELDEQTSGDAGDVYGEAGILLIAGPINIPPAAMYKPEGIFQRYELAQAIQPTQPAKQEQVTPVVVSAPSSDTFTAHGSSRATKPEAQKASQPAALRSKTSEVVKTAKAQPMAAAKARQRMASETFTSHASSSKKATAQPATRPAANAFLSAAMSPAPPDISQFIGTIPAGKSVTISFQVTVKSAAAFTGTSPQVSNQGTITADDPNGGTITVLTDDTTVGGANNPTVTPVDSQPDLQITKTDGAVVAVPGGTISYTLAYNNTNGKRAANNTVITETIPANTVFNAGASNPSWSCPGGTSAGNTCTLAIGNLPAGAAGGSAIFAVTVVNPVPTGVTAISNTATIADDGLFGVDGNPTNNTSMVITSLNAAINLTIGKSDGGSSATPGQNITYTLTYTNAGNKGATGVVINETVPANTTFNAGASTAGWSCAAITAGSACTFPVGSLAGGGAGGSVTFVVTIDNPVPGGTTQISNTATIGDDGTNGADANTANNTSSDTTPFDEAPTLGTYSNTAVVFGQNTTVSPTAPPADDKPGFTVGVAAPGFTGGLSVNQTTGVVTITNAGPAAAGAYTVTVTVTDSIGQTAVRTFQLTVNKANTTTTVTASPNPSNVGEQVTFTATVAAVAPGAGTPTGTVDFLDGATIICDDAALNGSGQATCQISSLTAGAHTITANYNGSSNFNTSTGTLPTQTVNEVNISGRKYTDNNGDGDDESGADPGLNGVTIELYNDVNSNGTYEAGTDTLAATTTTANVLGQDGKYSFNNKVPGRYIVREVLQPGYQQTAPAPVNPSTEGIYAINGSGSGGNFTAKDFGNFQLISISGRKFDDLNGNGNDEGGADPGLNGFTIELYNDVNGNGTLELSGGTPDTLKATTTTANVAAVDGKYSFTNIGPGKYIVREVVPAGYLQTAPTSPGTYAVTAASGVNVTNRDFGNFHKTTTTTVTSSLNPSFFTDSVTFTATVAANPPGSGTPTGTVTFFDGVNPICTNVALNGSGQATCTTTALAAGSHTISVQYSGDANFTSSTGTLPVPQVVNAKADLAVTKVDTPDPVVVGNNITYTISFTNNGPSAASNVTVTDAVPTNTTFVSATITTGTGWSISSQPAGGGTGNVVFSKASVPSGETATFEVVVNVNPATADLAVITNNAVAASATTDLTSGNNTGTTTTTVRRPGVLQFSAATYGVNENAGTASIDVTRTSGSGGTVTVHYTITNGTASSADYTGATSGTLTFTNGVTTQTISIPIVSDSLDEVDETLNLALDTPTGGAVLGAQTTAVLTITDDDATPSLSINDVTVTEGASGTVDATFTVTLSAASGQTVTVAYATADGTATIADGDYLAIPSTTLTFLPGETTKSVTVKVNGDLFFETNEDFFVNLSGQTNSTIADASGRGVITNDDAAPTLSINDVTVTEGNSSTTNATFTVTLTGATKNTTTVSYATANGTATAPSDYQAIPSTVLTFLPGETTKTITVLVNGDTNAEDNETFFVNLSGATNATITDNQGQGTITSDDTPLIGLSASTYSVNENGLHATVTVTRLGDLSQPARVDYLTSDPSGLNLCSQVTGNASSRCDYATTAGTLRFAAGETSKNIFIPIVNDVYIDGNETFTLTLSNAVGGEIGVPTSATITIIDNDTVPAPNPIDNDAFFIRQLYIDFLGREPEPGAVNAWLGILNHCAIPTDCDRIAVARGFVRSPEFQDRGFFVYRTFKTLGRIAHYNEFIPDMARLSGFLNAQELEANKADYILMFMERPEFKTLYDPTLNNPTAYVDKLLQSVQLPGHPGRAGWIAGLTNNTLTRAQVLRQLIDSGELYIAYVNEAFIIMNYFGFLRRDADAAYRTWIDIFNHTNDDRIIINGFLNSLEYRLRFGPN